MLFQGRLIVDNVPEAVISGFYDGKAWRSPHIEEAYEVKVFPPKMGEGGKWPLLTAASIRDYQGDIRWAVQTLMDITELRHAEETAWENEEQYRELNGRRNKGQPSPGRHRFTSSPCRGTCCRATSGKVRTTPPACRRRPSSPRSPFGPGRIPGAHHCRYPDNVH